MTGKSSTHSTRTPHDWEQLIERYYAGETSLHEEEELRKFLFSGEADDRYDDIRAVLAYTRLPDDRQKVRPQPPLWY